MVATPRLLESIRDVTPGQGQQILCASSLGLQATTLWPSHIAKCQHDNFLAFMGLHGSSLFVSKLPAFLTVVAFRFNNDDHGLGNNQNIWLHPYAVPRSGQRGPKGECWLNLWVRFFIVAAKDLYIAQQGPYDWRWQVRQPTEDHCCEKVFSTGEEVLPDVSQICAHSLRELSFLVCLPHSGRLAHWWTVLGFGHPSGQAHELAYDLPVGPLDLYRTGYPSSY
jgi:hypothetical protein